MQPHADGLALLDAAVDLDRETAGGQVDDGSGGALAPECEVAGAANLDAFLAASIARGHPGSPYAKFCRINGRAP